MLEAYNETEAGRYIKKLLGKIREKKETTFMFKSEETQYTSSIGALKEGAIAPPLKISILKI